MHVFNSWNDDAVSDKNRVIKTRAQTDDTSVWKAVGAYGWTPPSLPAPLSRDGSNRVLRNESRKTNERKWRGSKKPGLGECQCISEYYLVLFSSIISIVSIIVTALLM